MTTEEFISNYEYIITRRALKKEFPFIIDVIPSEGFEKYNFLKYVNVVIDPYKIIDMYPELGPVYKYMPYATKTEDGKYYVSYTFNMFLEGDEEQSKEIRTDIDDVISAISRSDSIPKDMQLPEGHIEVSTYLVPVDLVKRHNDNTK